MPAVFVVIWSTGFIVARYGMPHAPPMTFLAWRFALSALALALWVAAARAVWPRSRAQVAHLAVTGLLMHAGYLGGVWAAVKWGLGAGTAALIVGLQPLLTAVWLSAAGPAATRVHARQWWGLALGLLGLTLVLWSRLGLGELTLVAVSPAALALLSITAGTLYQKRHVQPCDVRSASLVQLLAALLVTLPLAWLEAEPLRWHPELVGALAWSVGALTLGGSSLLYLLIQRGAATQVASLMYLVPPCTAVMAWGLFNEALGPRLLLGIAITVIGVRLATQAAAAPAQPLKPQP